MGDFCSEWKWVQHHMPALPCAVSMAITRDVELLAKLWTLTV